MTATTTEINAVLTYALKVTRLRDFQALLNRDNPGHFHEMFSVVGITKGKTTLIDVGSNIDEFCVNDVIKFAEVSVAEWDSRLKNLNPELARVRAISGTELEIFKYTDDLSAFSGTALIFSTLNKDIFKNIISMTIARFHAGTRIVFDYTSEIHLSTMVKILRLELLDLNAFDKSMLNNEIKSDLDFMKTAKKIDYTSEQISISETDANNNSNMDNTNFKSLRGI